MPVPSAIRFHSVERVPEIAMVADFITEVPEFVTVIPRLPPPLQEAVMEVVTVALQLLDEPEVEVDEVDVDVEVECVDVDVEDAVAVTVTLDEVEHGDVPHSH